MSQRLVRPAALAAAMWLLMAAPARAQSTPALTVTSPSAGEWIAADTAIELVVTGPRPLPGRLAVMIGDVDWTALFTLTSSGLRSDPSVVRLPTGEQALVVYLVTDAGWSEIARMQLRILTRGGFERAEVKPVADVNNKGQVALGREPEAPATSRDTFQDFTLNLGLGTTFLRRGWTTHTQLSIVGVTNQPEALRFATEQDEAPRIDLASYLVSTDSGRVKLSLGHVSFGTHRHLLNAFASRGAVATFHLGSRADMSFSAVNGSPIVGWSNPLGVTESDHLVMGATFGLELAPRAGATRVEASLLDAKLLPRSGYNQGSIVDAEHNSGLGLRLIAADAKQRFRLDGGLARTRFVNPDDPLVDGGATLVPAREDTRSARYLDLSYALLQKSRATLSAAFRHELVQPLFGSLHGFVRPDVLQNVIEASGVFAGVAVQGSATWSHDNLDDLASILTTFTRAQQVNVALPLTSFSAGSGAAAWPTISWSLARTHQYGDDVPVNSDFQPTHVPDQISTNQSLGVEWQLAKWRAGYRFNRSFQDNRQIGRAQADLGNLTNTISVGIAPDPRVDLGVDLGFEGADNREITRTDTTRRVSVNGNWRPASRSTLTGLFAITSQTNSVDATESHNADVSLQFAQTIPLARRPSGKPSAQLFVRYARLAVRTLDAAAKESLTHFWTVNTGVTFSLF